METELTNAPISMHEPYLVRLDVFEGPLDLLLHLIEREELDITLVSLALVADQYMAHLSDLQERSAASLAEFLSTAALLLVIKSRVLLPQPATISDEDDDLGMDLVERLIEYRRYRQAAARLQEIMDSGVRTFPRLAPAPRPERHLRPGEATVDDLYQALANLLQQEPPAPVDRVVAPIIVHISDCVDNIVAHLNRKPRVRFSALFAEARTRVHVIVTFLAMLELIKLQRIRATQDEQYGEIVIQVREPDPDTKAPELDLDQYGDS